MRRYFTAFCAVCALLLLPALAFASGTSESNVSKAAPKAQHVTITILGLTPEYTQAVKTMVKDYETQNPGVTVDFQIPADNFYTLLKTRFAAGNPPDIFQLYESDMRAWVGKLQDLSDQPWMAHVQPEGLRFMTVNGKKYGFPLYEEATGIVYNKDLFAEAGVTHVPTTLSGLKSTAEKLKASGIQAFGDAWKDWGFLGQLLGKTFAYQPNQAEFVKGLDNKTKSIGDLKYINNFFTLIDLTDNYGFGKQSIGYDYNQQIADFAAGKFAMMDQGTWYTAPVLKQNPKIHMGMFATPLTDNPSNSKLAVATTTYFVVNKSSSVVKQADAFLDWLHTNYAHYMVEPMKVAPVFNDVSTGDLGPLYADMYGYVGKHMTYDNFGIELWPSGFITDLATPLQAYIAGAATKAQTIQQLEKLWRQDSQRQ